MPNVLVGAAKAATNVHHLIAAFAAPTEHLTAPRFAAQLPKRKHSMTARDAFLSAPTFTENAVTNDHLN